MNQSCKVTVSTYMRKRVKRNGNFVIIREFIYTVFLQIFYKFCKLLYCTPTLYTNKAADHAQGLRYYAGTRIWSGISDILDSFEHLAWASLDTGRTA